MTYKKTIAYYNNPKNYYAESTVKADMSEGYNHFLNYLPLTGTIMDLGCGSGRDSLFFIKRGYKVVPVDGSQRMCEETTKLIGYKCILRRPTDMGAFTDGQCAFLPDRQNDIIPRCS